MILTIDQKRHCLLLDSREVQLTPQEFRIMCYLAQHMGKVVRKRALIGVLETDASAASLPGAATARALELVIFRLRRKLEDDAKSPRFLETRHGVGYILHNARLVFDPEPQSHNGINMSPAPNLIQRPIFTAFSAGLLERIDNWTILTQREWNIFMLLGDREMAQLTNHALANQLGIAENTLKKHLQNIYRKLQVSNRASASILSARVQLHLYAEQQFMKGAGKMDSSQQLKQNEAIVRQYYQALAARDVTVAAPLLAEDVVRIGVIFDNEPPQITRGKEQLLARNQRVIDDNGEIEVSNIHAEGDRVTCFVRISTDTTRREGIAPLEEHVEYLLQDGKIMSYKAVSTPASAAKIRSVMA